MHTTIYPSQSSWKGRLDKLANQLQLKLAATVSEGRSCTLGALTKWRPFADCWRQRRYADNSYGGARGLLSPTNFEKKDEKDVRILVVFEWIQRHQLL